jgi:hypothetical protein
MGRCYHGSSSSSTHWQAVRSSRQHLLQHLRNSLCLQQQQGMDVLQCYYSLGLGLQVALLHHLPLLTLQRLRLQGVRQMAAPVLLRRQLQAPSCLHCRRQYRRSWLRPLAACMAQPRSRSPHRQQEQVCCLAVGPCI